MTRRVTALCAQLVPTPQPQAWPHARTAPLASFSGTQVLMNQSTIANLIVPPAERVSTRNLKAQQNALRALRASICLTRNSSEIATVRTIAGYAMLDPTHRKMPRNALAAPQELTTRMMLQMQLFTTMSMMTVLAARLRRMAQQLAQPAVARAIAAPPERDLKKDPNRASPANLVVTRTLRLTSAKHVHTGAILRPLAPRRAPRVWPATTWQGTIRFVQPVVRQCWCSSSAPVRALVFAWSVCTWNPLHFHQHT